MVDHAKPTANCAGEILQATGEFIGGLWPYDSEDAALALAGWAHKAATRASEGSTTAYQLAAFTGADTSGQAFEVLMQRFASDSSKLLTNHDELMKFGQWMALVSTAISTAKNAIAAACDGHEADHNARLKSEKSANLGKLDGSERTQAAKDASMKAARETAAAARREMEIQISLAEMAMGILETTGKLPETTTPAAELKKLAGSGEDPGLSPASFNNEAIDRALKGTPERRRDFDTPDRHRAEANPAAPATDGTNRS
ncbi:MAG: hypothetical protein WA988_12070 [Candidatus Nanopelagicales bacterium]